MGMAEHSDPPAEAARPVRRIRTGAPPKLRGRASRGRERGSTSLEMALLTPPALLVLALAIATGRLVLATSAVDQAAADAARAASIARNATAAHDNAVQAANATLAREGLQCSSLTVSVDTSGFATPVGQAAEVTATVECVVDLSDLAIPGMPGHLTERAAMTSPLDLFRGR